MKYRLIARLIPLVLLLLVWHVGQAREGGGTVTVVNRTVIPLQITDRQDLVLTQVAPTRSVVIPAPLGRNTFRAQRLDGSLYLEATVVVNTRSSVVWDILPTEAVLEVHNQTTKDVLIEVDGQPLVEVMAGKTLRIDGIRPGSRHLTASNEGIPMAGTVAELVKHDTYVWSLGQPGHQDVGIPVLRVRNFSGQPVRIVINGQRRIDLSPADSAALVGIKPGEVKVEAQALRSGATVARETLTLIAGQTFVWEVAGPEGKRATVEVKNQTGKALKVCVDGTFCLRIKPRSSARYDALAPGLHTFQAYDLATDRLLEALEADLTSRAPYEWTVGAAE